MNTARNTKRNVLLALTGTAIAVMVGLASRSAQPSEQEARKMNTFTQNMQTYCVGRFLIGAPQEATPREGTYGFRIAEIRPAQKSTVPVDERLRGLDRALAERVSAQLTWKDGYGDPMGPAQVFKPEFNIRSIWFGKAGAGYKDSDRMEGFVVRPDGNFEFETNATTVKRVQEFNDLLIEIAPTLSVRHNNVIPTQSGFCFSNGFAALHPKHGEGVEWGWALSSYPGVRFGLRIKSNTDILKEGILDREAGILKSIEQALGKEAPSTIQTLRKRRFDLDGMAAQEWLKELRGPSTEYEFTLDIPGKPNDLANPFITLSLRVGDLNKKGDVKPSLTPGEAIALWDAVIQTLRLRPGAV